MARRNLSIPHERRKLALRSAIMTSNVKIAEHKERRERAKQELNAMNPKPTKKEEVI